MAGKTTSLNVTGANPQSETNIGGDVAVTTDTDVSVDEVSVEVGSDRWTDVRARVEAISGIRLQNVKFSEDEPTEDSVEAFEKALHKADPEAAEGLGRQYANAAKGMGYSVTLTKEA